jgi:hypothetical protein
MNRIRYSSIGASLAIALAGAGFAQDQSQSQRQSQQQQRQSFQSSEHGQRAAREMSQLDRDRDQRVGQQEVNPQLVAAWAEIDVTRDGSVGRPQQRRANRPAGVSVEPAMNDAANGGAGHPPFRTLRALP